LAGRFDCLSPFFGCSHYAQPEIELRKSDDIGHAGAVFTILLAVEHFRIGCAGRNEYQRIDVIGSNPRFGILMYSLASLRSASEKSLLNAEIVENDMRGIGIGAWQG